MNDKVVLPEYIFMHLSKYNNVLIGRLQLLKYGEENIICACKEKGFSVKLVKITHEGEMERKRHHGKKSKYPVNTAYILELI